MDLILFLLLQCFKDICVQAPHKLLRILPTFRSDEASKFFGNYVITFFDIASIACLQLPMKVYSPNRVAKQ